MDSLEWVFSWVVNINGDASLAADRVFGPATTTRHVYDVAAQHVVGGAMQGINGNCLSSFRNNFYKYSEVIVTGLLDNWG